MNPLLIKWIAGVVLLAASLAGAYMKGHNAGKDKIAAQWNEDKLKQAQATAAAESAHRAKEQQLVTQTMEAINAAKKRESILKADALSSRNELDSLRSQSATFRSSLPSLTAESVRNYATTLSIVFEDCARKYQELGIEADGHANDTLMLEQAWPK